ncbi:filamentous hemagglutinin N-terminal domain-containing protein [Herbaspirillum sp. DW155]|uniref:two-partner secretion domain-containing protein n=1 Tax=Herbaspirillum sp. DW155 TaxID=3095609 RepID=UPI0030933145|nr:filamentous hemagglutinin N-terminal domain-containing protein [Herbaspirillum sp. DW155]
MNRIFKTIYNKKLGRIDVVSEIASNCALTSSVNEQAGRSAAANGMLLLALKPLTVVLWAAFGLIALPVMQAVAGGLPTNGQVAVGQGSIASNGNAMTVKQATDRMAINWQSFDIGAKNSVTFIQPASSSVALNRVIGGGSASQIMGVLNANGQVFLLNPNGVLVGKDAVINTGGLLASTYSMSDANFAAGKYELRASAASVGQVINQGHLRATSGGFVVLAANQVDNQGVISTPGGTTSLVAGQQITLQVDGNGTTVSVDGSVVDALVKNQGLITAQDGRVYLTARGQQQVLNESVNNSGVIRANSLSSLGGQVTLDGGSAGIVTQAGSIDVSGLRGGKVVVTGQNVHLVTGSTIDATGQQGGGQVNVGGGWQGKDASIANAQAVVMDRGAVIDVSARQKGDGGTAVLWSDNYTNFQGLILARGAQQGGNGGQVETSSHGNLQAFGSVDASAVNGLAGNWLLDPTDVTIVSSSTVNNTDSGSAIWQPTGNGSQILNTSINSQLNAGTNVTILTNGSDVTGQLGNITVGADIVKSTGNTATSLTLKADGNIVISNHNITSTAGALDVNLCAGQSSAVTSILVNNANITTNNGSLRMGQANASNNVSINVTASTIDVGSSTGSNIIGQSATGPAVLLNNSVIRATGGAPVAINGQSGTGIGVYVTGTSNLTNTAITAGSQTTTGFREDVAARVADSTIVATSNSGQTTTAAPAADIYGTIVNSTINGTTNHTNTGLAMSAGVVVGNGAKIIDSTLTGRAKAWDAGLLLYNATLTNSTLVGYGGPNDGVTNNLTGIQVRGNFTGTNVTLQGSSPNTKQGIWFTNGGTITVAGYFNISGYSAKGTGVDLSNSAVTISAGTLNICGSSSSGKGFNLNFTKIGGIANAANITLSSKGSPDIVRNVIGTKTFTPVELMTIVMPRGIENLTSVNATSFNLSANGDFVLDYTQPGRLGGWLLSGANVNVTGGNASFKGVSFENGNITVTGNLNLGAADSNITLSNEQISAGNVTINANTAIISNGTITATNNVLLGGTNITLSNEQVSAGNVTVNVSNNGTISNGTITATNNVLLGGTNITLSNEQVSAGNVTVNVSNNGTISNGTITATNNVLLGGTNITLSNENVSAGNVSVSASTVTINSSNITASNAIKIDASANYSNLSYKNRAVSLNNSKFKASTLDVNATANSLNGTAAGGSGVTLNNDIFDLSGSGQITGVSNGGFDIYYDGTPGVVLTGTITVLNGNLAISGDGGEYTPGIRANTGIVLNVAAGASLNLDAKSNFVKTTGLYAPYSAAFTVVDISSDSPQALTVTGGGSVTLTGTSSGGSSGAIFSDLNVGNNTTVTVNATANNGSGLAFNNISTQSGAVVNLIGTSVNGSGVQIGNLPAGGTRANTLTEASGASVSIQGSSTNGTGVNVTNTTLNGVNVTGGTTGNGSGVTISGTLTETNGASVTANGGANGTAVTLNNATLSNTSLGSNSLNATAQNGTAIAVTGNTTLTNLTLNGSSNNGTGVSVAGNLTQTGASATNGTSVNGSGVNVSGNVTGGNVTGNSTNGTGVNVTGANVTGTNVTGNSSTGAGVNVSGNTTLDGTSITGNSTLADGVNISGNLTNINGTTINGTGNTSGVNVSGNVTGGNVTGNSANGTGVNVNGSNVTGANVTGDSSAGTGVNISGNTTVTNGKTEGNSDSGTGVQVNAGAQVTGGSVNGSSISGVGVSNDGVIVNANVISSSRAGGAIGGGGNISGSTVQQTTLRRKPGVVTGGPDSVSGRSTYLTLGKTFMSSFPRRKTSEDTRSTVKNLTICERGSKSSKCQ